ncbi:GNAT family N-acetyltransferase [Clostridium subterminale]|uniref:GNAT family N-acetyltransferase n=1 Tax=Clostridium subterminale TaxID=1550 RepID=A0ABN1KY09_CLOSU
MNLNEVKLEPVDIESRAKLENLVSIYLHDLSEFADDLKINEDGKFEYDGLEMYFKSEDLTSYFITYQGEVAGFILFNTGKYAPRDIDYVVHELFLLKGFRKKGIGNAAIRILLDTYKGKYRIEQISSNKPAVNFWTKFYENQGIKYIELKERHYDLECSIQIFSI